jgi:hypothetical protein
VKPLLERRRFFPRLAPAAVVARLRPLPIVSRRRPLVISVAVFGGTVLLLLLLVGMFSRRGPDPLLDAPARPAAAPARPAAPASCVALGTTTEQARELMARGQLTAALAAADAGLARPVAAGCAGAHLDLARLWYTADVDDLLATPVEDEARVRQAPARWVAIERRADDLGVPTTERRPAMALAQTAYDRGLWQLADAAFRDAWAVGYEGAEGVEFRHALLRNWGSELVLRGSPADGQRGLGMLKTANAIARTYDLQTDVACTDLRALGVANCATAIGDPDEPTLTVPRRAGGR